MLCVPGSLTDWQIDEWLIPGISRVKLGQGTMEWSRTEVHRLPLAEDSLHYEIASHHSIFSWNQNVSQHESGEN